MARTVKEETQKKTVSKQDLKRVQKEADRLRSMASDYSGQHGSYLKNQIENFNLNRRALAWVLSLMRLEASERAAVIRNSLDYLHKLGGFDQMEMFDDTAKILRAIIETIESSPPPSPEPDEAIGALVN